MYWSNRLRFHLKERLIARFFDPPVTPPSALDQVTEAPPIYAHYFFKPLLCLLGLLGKRLLAKRGSAGVSVDRGLNVVPGFLGVKCKLRDVI